MPPSNLYPPGDKCYSHTFQQQSSIRSAPTLDYQSCVYQSQPAYSAPFWYPHNHLFYHHSYPVMAASNSDDMEDFQRLSDGYRPNLPGPLVGEKLPVNNLAIEYAQADPTYVVKTAALAQTYSSYRTIKGDGQCGWRATVFGYFETLLQYGDRDSLQQERVRIQSFEDTMKMVGIDYDMLVDMFDYTWELFTAIQNAIEDEVRGDDVLLEFFNDVGKSDSIVYHFKMMTSAFMQLHAEDYEAFLEDSVENYRVTRIDPSNQEIDQIGLQALTNAIIAPANFALEVLYLDRSIGEVATPHSLVDDFDGKPVIRLLYRPGHYDMIYKEEKHRVQVFLQKDNMIPQDLTLEEPTTYAGDLEAYLFPGPQHPRSNDQSGSIHDITQSPQNQNTNQLTFTQQPQSLCLIEHPHYQNHSHSMPLLTMEIPQAYPMQYPSPCSTDMSSPIYPTTPLLSSRPTPSASNAKSPINEPQIRLNANCFNYRLKHESVPLCTQTYGSIAALSTAHFRNQDFQPHMWRAEEEYMR